MPQAERYMLWNLSYTKTSAQNVIIKDGEELSKIEERTQTEPQKHLKIAPSRQVHAVKVSLLR